MIKYLEESTNNVKSRQKYSKMIQIIAYCTIWGNVNNYILAWWQCRRIGILDCGIYLVYLSQLLLFQS